LTTIHGNSSQAGLHVIQFTTTTANQVVLNWMAGNGQQLNGIGPKILFLAPYAHGGFNETSGLFTIRSNMQLVQAALQADGYKADFGDLAQICYQQPLTIVSGNPVAICAGTDGTHPTNVASASIAAYVEQKIDTFAARNPVSFASIGNIFQKKTSAATVAPTVNQIYDTSYSNVGTNWTIDSGITQATTLSGPQNDTVLTYTGSGTSGVSLLASQPVQLITGQTYCPSTWANTSGMTTGNIQVLFCTTRSCGTPLSSAFLGAGLPGQQVQPACYTSTYTGSAVLMDQFHGVGGTGFNGTGYAGELMLTGAPSSVFIPNLATGPGTYNNGSNFSSLYVNGVAVMNINTPAWLQNVGSGVDGAETCNGNLSGDNYYTTFSVPFGDTCTINNVAGLTVHATGACTIAGSIVTNQTGGSGQVGGGSGGGSGGGAAAGSAGAPTYMTVAGSGPGAASGGTAGALTGGSGANGAQPTVAFQRYLYNGIGQDGLYLAGGAGKAGGSSGGAAGGGGLGFTLICASITGTDGTHTGTINVSGAAGGNAAANSTGAGSGGGGGVIFLSSQSAVGTWPTLTTTGGSGGSCLSFSVCGTGGNGGAGWSVETSGW
jgi:hypothetical protein